MTRINSRYTDGFTLVELIIVVLIIGVISTIAMVSYQGLQGKARDTSVLSDLDNMDGLQTNYGLKNKTAGLAYYSGTGPSSQLGFTPSPGNVIDVVINNDDYCIRGYNPNSTKKSINDAFEKESSSGVCALLPPSAAASGIETVTIGSQVWMKYNLNVGTKIPTTNNFTNESPGAQVTQKHCKSDDDNYCNTYGAVYTWDEALGYPAYGTAEGDRGICPAGFHIPTSTEFGALATYLGGASVAGGKMKEAGTAHWQSPNTSATNSSGFTALPGGYGYYENYYGLYTDEYFWTSTQAPPISEAYYYYLYNTDAVLHSFYDAKTNALHVRCIAD